MSTYLLPCSPGPAGHHEHAASTGLLGLGWLGPALGVGPHRLGIASISRPDPSAIPYRGFSLAVCGLRCICPRLTPGIPVVPVLDGGLTVLLWGTLLLCLAA